MLINSELLDQLTRRAKESPRKRIAMDLRTTSDDQSQRILNAVEPGTVLPIHRHRDTTETIVVLRGRVRQNYYDEQGRKMASFTLAPGTDTMGMSVPTGQWHALESLETGSVILETKNGAYAPLCADDILNPEKQL